jgi:hypothetical protein
MAAAIGEIFKEAGIATGVGVASLSKAAGKSLEVAGKTSAKAVEVTGVVADKSLNVTKKGVEVGANVTMAGLNTAGKVSTAALETTAVATQAAANITQAAARSTANASAATLKASANIVKSGVGATSKIANAALIGTTQVTTDTLKGSADAASAAAKFSLGSVTTALKGLDNLRDLGSMKGQNWVNKVRNKTIQGRKITDVKQPQTIILLLEQEFLKVTKDLEESFHDTIDSNELALTVLLVNIKDLYCMSVWRRMTKGTCPRNISTRKSLEQKITLQKSELENKSKFFFVMMTQKKNETISQFKTGAQTIIREKKDEAERVDAIKDFFTTKLDEFSSFVAKQLTKLTSTFETRSSQYQKIIENAAEGTFAINGVFNQPSSAPAAGGTRKQKKRAKKTRKQ